MHFLVCIQYVRKILILQVDNAFTEAGSKKYLVLIEAVSFYWKC